MKLYILICSSFLVLAACDRAGTSSSGGGAEYLDAESISGIRYKIVDPTHKRLADRVERVINNSNYSIYYAALIDNITIVPKSRVETGWWAMISGPNVWMAYDAIEGRSDRQIDQLVSHEAEHRSKGMVDGDSDYRHRTEWSCTIQLYGGKTKNKCTFPEAIEKIQ